MHEVKIYGEIIHQAEKDNGGKGFCLSDLQAQLSKAEGQPIKVRINSPGGDGDEGFAMYDELRRYAKDNSVKVHTFAEVCCASAATVVFLAGDVRELSRNIEPFVHNAWVGVEGDSRKLMQVAEQLELYNVKLANHYAAHTNLTYEEARELMDAETSLTPKEAIAMRFATTMENVFRPAALQRFENQNPNTMTKKKESLLNKFMKILEGVKNKIVFTADQAEVDFFELGDDDEVTVGAKATIDGANAEGEVVMADGDTYVFAAGVLTEIKEGEEEEDGEEDDAMAALTQENADLKAKLADHEASVLAKETEIKTLRNAVNQFKALKSEFEGTEAPGKEKPKNKVDEPAKGSRAAKAIANYK